jgi:hypothetical protein
VNLLFSPRTFSKTRLVPENSFLLNASKETGLISVMGAASGFCVAELVVSLLFDEQATRKTSEMEERSAIIFFMNRLARLAFGLNAILAWVGVIGSLTVDATGVVIVPQFGPSYFGGHADGLAGSIPRVIDNLSYFTIWSNILVAITTTMIYRNMNRSSQRLKVMRLSSLMMITVTMLVYILILAPDANPQSWNVYTNLLLHYITPPVTILVWLFFGPRKWISWKIIFSALLIPITYILYTFARGAVFGKYPYGFINVVELGYVGAIIGTGVVLVLGLLIFLIYFIIDKLIPSSK